MGAGHSGKHQLGSVEAYPVKRQDSIGYGGKETSNSFGHSFRKGLGNMLLPSSGQTMASSPSSSSSKGKSPSIGRAKGRRQSGTVDVEPGDVKINTVKHRTNNKSGASLAAAKENIGRSREEYYVPTLATESGRQRSAMMSNYLSSNIDTDTVSNSRVSVPMEASRMYSADNANNGYVVSSQAKATTATTATATTATTTTTSNATNSNNKSGLGYGSAAANKAMEMNSVHHNRTQANNGATTMAYQQHHHNHHHRHHRHQASDNSPTSIQQPSFHLSRAINTKTTSHVLNTQANSSDSSSSTDGSSSGNVVMDRASGRKLQKHSRHNHQSQHLQQLGQTFPSPAAARTIQQNHHQHQPVARLANECCSPNSPYQVVPGFTSPPHNQQQQQQQPQQQQRQHWQRYAADPASSASFYSTYSDDRYLVAADNGDAPAPTGQRYHLRNQDQQDPMGLANYNSCQQQQYLVDNYPTGHMLPSNPAGQLPIHYNRSYSFGSSLNLDSNKIRSQNPLASLFQQPLSGTPSIGNPNKQQYANTIQVTRRNNQSARSPNGRSAPGSLKRVKSSILSAQQASYEAMRTIDMYLIRQIARSCMDFEMEQKIELEIRLRELAAQSILEARNEIDVLEVEKSLLTSDQRMNYYASHLEQQRKKLSNPSLSTVDSGRGSKNDHATSDRRTGSRRSQPRSDVVGGPTGSASNNGDTDSPSFSSLSNSQSPSKLSPVSGQSANDESQASFTSRSHHSRTGLRHSQSSSSAIVNSLSARKRAKSRRREQLIQNLAQQNNLDFNSVIVGRASVSVSEIRIPLMWRDVDHFKNRGDYKRFAVFCLLKIGSQIYDTQLITDVDRQVTDVTFDDFIVFNDIDYDFELTLEIYSCVYLEQFSLSSTPRKLKDKLTSSIGRAMGKRLATQTASPSYTKELEAYDKSYRFALIASASLQLEDASNSVKTYDLVLLSPSAHNRQHQLTSPNSLSRSYHGSSKDSRNAANSYHHINSTQLTSINTSKNAHKNALPLFGHVCCRLFIRPDVFDKNITSALI